MAVKMVIKYSLMNYGDGGVVKMVMSVVLKVVGKLMRNLMQMVVRVMVVVKMELMNVVMMLND